MTKLETKSIKPTMGSVMDEKPFDYEQFISLTAENLIIQHHRRKGDFTYFNFMTENESEKLCFVVSQDQELIKHLKMIKTDLKNDPKRTLDLFQEEKSQFSQVSIKDLLINLEENQADFHLSVDGRDYSFRLAKGGKVQKLINKIDTYVEEIENINEYKDNTQKLKI